jgi:hypothetical protein
MTARNIVTRIERLEARRRSDDEMLLIWRKPGQDTDAAVAEFKKAGLFGSGDLVLCAEWYGVGELPTARWIRRPEYDLTKKQQDSLDRNIEKIAGRDGVKETPAGPDYDLIHLSDDQLLHICLGVKT